LIKDGNYAVGIQFNTPYIAELSNATVCNEPLFLYVEKKIGELSENIICTASPLAFHVDEKTINEAKSFLSKYDIVEIGDENETIIRFVKNENGSVKKISYKTIRNYFDFFEESEKVKMEIIFMNIANGVRFASVDGVIISPFAKIGKGTEIHASTEIRGESEIGENCIIGPCSVISNSKIGNVCKVNATQIYDAVLEDDVNIGPFSQVRPNSRLCSGVRIGDFVEIKNSVVGNDSHASHLTYIGDSDVGSKVNFGCGTVTSNYDGKNKFRTVVGDNVFIGCNTNLIAPVKVGNNSYVAAGSTITEDVPEGSLGIARARQTVKEDWANKRRAEGKLK